MPYFNQFPVLDYNLSGVNGNTKEVTDIWRRVKVRSKIANNVSLYDKFDVPEVIHLKLLHTKYMVTQSIFGLCV